MCSLMEIKDSSLFYCPSESPGSVSIYQKIPGSRGEQTLFPQLLLHKLSERPLQPQMQSFLPHSLNHQWQKPIVCNAFFLNIWVWLNSSKAQKITVNNIKLNVRHNSIKFPSFPCRPRPLLLSPFFFFCLLFVLQKMTLAPVTLLHRPTHLLFL